MHFIDNLLIILYLCQNKRQSCDTLKKSPLVFKECNYTTLQNYCKVGYILGDSIANIKNLLLKYEGVTEKSEYLFI